MPDVTAEGPPLCSYYKVGACKFGGSCRFKHLDCRDGEACSRRKIYDTFGYIYCSYYGELYFEVFIGFRRWRCYSFRQ